ncbi:MAG: HD domain-containing protein [Patescibacteria group bacterium]|nr:HD domain-containing protein [Patescibacteria group bacterium]
MNKFQKIVNFLFEAETLKRIPRAGWKDAGIERAESVAEHSFITALIAYFLGKLEKANSEKAALIALFHDLGETRIGDTNMITKFYLKTDEAEEKAFFDQIKGLVGEEEIGKFYKEWIEQKTKEAIVAKDADLLEETFQAKCYLASGNKLLGDWIDYWGIKLRTESAKKLFEEIKKTEIDEWWREIPEMKKEIKKLKKAKR